MIIYIKNGRNTILSGLRIGKTEHKILEFLGLHPNQFIQHIQKGIDADYPTTHTAVKRLTEEKGLVEIKGKRLTERKQLHPIYGLSEKGISFIIASDNINLNYVTLLRNYSESDLFSGVKDLLEFIKDNMGEKFYNEFQRFIGKTGLALYDMELDNVDQAFAILGGAFQGWLFSKMMKSNKLAKKFEKMAEDFHNNPKLKKFLLERIEKGPSKELKEKWGWNI